jgi:hypothetical protein
MSARASAPRKIVKEIIAKRFWKFYTVFSGIFFVYRGTTAWPELSIWLMPRGTRGWDSPRSIQHTHRDTYPDHRSGVKPNACLDRADAGDGMAMAGVPIMPSRSRPGKQIATRRMGAPTCARFGAFMTWCCSVAADREELFVFSLCLMPSRSRERVLAHAKKHLKIFVKK